MGTHIPKYQKYMSFSIFNIKRVCNKLLNDVCMSILFSMVVGHQKLQHEKICQFLVRQRTTEYSLFDIRENFCRIG